MFEDEEDECCASLRTAWRKNVEELRMEYQAAVRKVEAELYRSFKALRAEAEAVMTRCSYCAAGVKRTPLEEQFRDYLGKPHAEHMPADIKAVGEALPPGLRRAEYPMWCSVEDAPYALARAVLASPEAAVTEPQFLCPRGHKHLEGSAFCPACGAGPVLPVEVMKN